jgi:predicted nucleic acid-binding protein
MRVLVDTSVWSLALRRRTRSEAPAVEELRRLIDQGRVAMIGPIRQEILSGIRTPDSFERLREHLRPYSDEPLQMGDFERAAEHFNTCRTRGIQGSNTDFLICAVAERRGFPILSTDADFTRFAAVLPIALHGGGTPGAGR